VALTRHAACECAANNHAIRVNAISPGVIRTAMVIDTAENLQCVAATHPLGINEKQDIAEAALYLASDAARWATGHEPTVDGGFGVRP
jgi:NAD(P)-dependent dehydrogenase (short-subunit alcohol dehydrogenase family)